MSEHGRSGRYAIGCRCDACVAWRRTYDRLRYRKTHKPDLDRVREAAAILGYGLTPLQEGAP